MLPELSLISRLFPFFLHSAPLERATYFVIAFQTHRALSAPRHSSYRCAHWSRARDAQKILAFFSVGKRSDEEDFGCLCLCMSLRLALKL